jgi:ATP/maltotriose-dependent transcriptional regulator MalT
MLHIERLIEAARQSGADGDIAFDGALESASWLANRLGKPALSMELNDERIRRARASGDLARIAHALATSVIACMNSGEQERGLEIAREAVETSRACGVVAIRTRALRSLAAIYLNLERPDEAVTLYEEFFSLDEAQIPPIQYAVALHDYGLAYKNLDRPEKAQPLLSRSIERATALGDYGAACHGYQTLGMVLFESGNHRAAFEHLHKAVEISVNNINLRTQLEALEHLVLASIREDQYEQIAFVLGAVEGARSRLGGYKPTAHQQEEAEAIRNGLRSRMGERAFEAAYVRGQSATIAQGVDAALKLECGIITLAHADRLSVLSAREREIALLAAKGTSNRDIAETLSLSVRTVETHIASIFRKLGIDRRERILIQNT